jgi:leucyl/phenylalanyl-tRNA--protein transferase
MSQPEPLSAEQLIYAYASGYFPMGNEEGEIRWYNPDPRAIIPIESYAPAKSLRPILNKGIFECRINQSFEQVMRHCSQPRSEDDGVWISEEIIQAYTDLHRAGLAHSVEVYMDGKLVGGLYGVCLGGAFFGESMFSLVSNASKVAFHHLLVRLREQGFDLLDTQFINDHVERLGAIEIPQADYFFILKKALTKKCNFESFKRP